MISLLVSLRPMRSNHANKIETFNEVTVLCILYILLCFSDFIGSLEVRNQLGYLYIGVFTIYALVHIIPMLASASKEIYAKVKRRFQLNQLKKKKQESSVQ